MAPAYRETKKGIVFENGNRINYGQLFPKKGTTIMQRKLNSSQPPRDPPNLARDGGAKNIATPAIVPGQVRQTKGQPAAYHHGVTVDDLPNSGIIKSHEKPIPAHDGMSNGAKHDPAHGDAVLEEAARLGRPPEKA